LDIPEKANRGIYNQCDPANQQQNEKNDDQNQLVSHASPPDRLFAAGGG